jgi:Do/DeqQ family serine protease
MFNTLNQTVRRGALAAGAAALLVTGATWNGLAADTAVQSPAAVVATSQPSVNPVVAGGRDSYADVVKVVTPAVVTVRVQAKARVSPTQFQGEDDLFRRFFGERGVVPRRMPPTRRGLGSGVVVSPDGYILTNHHVVEGADDIVVEFSDQRQHDAKLVGSDEASDLALLKIEGTNLPSLTLGDSDTVQVGDVVLAVGNPLGVGQTVTMGIISAKGRSTYVGDGSYEDFLQTDAPINQGNSGGPLVNTRGELIGINSQILSPSGGNIGIGFAIPANMAKFVMTELRTNGTVRRARLGVSIQPVDSELAASLGLKEVSGAIVNSVDGGSAAAKAGVQVGDVIKSYNGQAVRDTNVLRNRVAETKPGTSATLVVVRDGKEQTLNVTLDALQGPQTARSGDAAPDDRTQLGVSVVPLTPQLAEQAGAPRNARGLLVQDVAPDGRAAAAGIQAGDIIREVNRKPADNIDTLRAEVRNTTDRPLLLLVMRGERDLFLTVPQG